MFEAWAREDVSETTTEKDDPDISIFCIDSQVYYTRNNNGVDEDDLTKEYDFTLRYFSSRETPNTSALIIH